MGRIAKAWNKPCQTEAEKETLFNEVLEMKSFNQKGGQPKVSNWFAWNKMAHEQMPEFFATKMVHDTGCGTGLLRLQIRWVSAWPGRGTGLLRLQIRGVSAWRVGKPTF